jgi:hypothetical protein
MRDHSWTNVLSGFIIQREEHRFRRAENGVLRRIIISPNRK